MRKNNAFRVFLFSAILFCLLPADARALECPASSSACPAVAEALATAEACQGDCSAQWQAVLDTSTTWAEQESSFTEDGSNTAYDAMRAEQAAGIAENAAIQLGNPSLASNALDASSNAVQACRYELGCVDAKNAAGSPTEPLSQDEAWDAIIYAEDITELDSAIALADSVGIHADNLGEPLLANAKRQMSEGDVAFKQEIQNRCEAYNCSTLQQISTLEEGAQQPEAPPEIPEEVTKTEEELLEDIKNANTDTLAEAVYNAKEANVGKEKIDQALAEAAQNNTGNAEFIGLAKAHCDVEGGCTTSEDFTRIQAGETPDDGEEEPQDVEFEPPPPAPVDATGCVDKNTTGYVFRVVGIITCYLNNAQAKMAGPVYEIFNGFVFSMITLAVVVYGAMLLLGMVPPISMDGRGLGPTTVVLLLKIGAIIYFVGQGNVLFEKYTKPTMEGLITMATPDLDLVCRDPDTKSTKPVPIEKIVNPDGDKDYVWKALDCVIEKVVGFSKTKAHQDAAGGIVTLMAGLLLVPGIGVIIATLMITFFLEIIFTMARAIHIYLISYMAIILLTLVAPLFVPLILFQSTRQYFNSWLKNVIGYTLQPMMLVFFLGMFASGIELVVYGGKENPNKYSFFNMLPVQNLEEVAYDGKKLMKQLRKGDSEEEGGKNKACLTDRLMFTNYISFDKGSLGMSPADLIMDAGVDYDLRVRCAALSQDLKGEEWNFAKDGVGVWDWYGDQKARCMDLIVQDIVPRGMPVEYFDPVNCAKRLQKMSKSDVVGQAGGDAEAGIKLILSIVANLATLVLLGFAMIALLKEIPKMTATITGTKNTPLPLENDIRSMATTVTKMLGKGK